MPTADLEAPVKVGSRSVRHQKIWIDLDNSPHVPFFRPIINELESRGYELLVTARDAYQTRELLDFYGVSGQVIGKHYGKKKLLKALGTCWRAAVLSPVVRKEKPALSIAHGSRSCLLASAALGIPHLMMTDYEFVAKIPTVKPAWLMVPSVVPGDHLGLDKSRVMKYPGIKEDVYLSSFRPDQTLRSRLGISPNDVLITVRPPATEAHYHNPEAEGLLTGALNLFARNPETKVLLLPRNKRQEADLRSAWAGGLASGKLLIPDHVEDGLNIIWNSDLVISGGGTMNREAAAMGVPVYSIFRGKIGAVDRYLADTGRLTLLTNSDEVKTKINVARRQKSLQRSNAGGAGALETIVDNIASILENNIRHQA